MFLFLGLVCWFSGLPRIYIYIYIHTYIYTHTHARHSHTLTLPCDNRYLSRCERKICWWACVFWLFEPLFVCALFLRRTPGYDASYPTPWAVLSGWLRTGLGHTKATPVAKRSRFAGGSGAPRPVIRPLVTVTPFRQIPAMCGPITMKTPSRQLRSSGKAHLSGGPPVSGGAIVSSRAVLQRLPSLKGDQLLFLFLDRAAGTLQRHTTAWRQWFDFARASAYLPGRPSVEQVLDFLCALASGAVCARARVGSLRFLAFKP